MFSYQHQILPSLFSAAVPGASGPEVAALVGPMVVDEPPVRLPIVDPIAAPGLFANLIRSFSHSLHRESHSQTCLPMYNIH